jgi:hypothetical protein
MQKFRYFTGYYFPAYMIFLGVVMLFVGAVLFSLDMIFAPLCLILLSAMFFTGHYGLEIDTKNKRYREYISILGFKNGKEKTYQALCGILIKSSLMSQTMYSLSNHSSSFRITEFDSYLEFDDGSRIHLISRRSKKKLLRKIQIISADLCVGILDKTTAQP